MTIIYMAASDTPTPAVVVVVVVGPRFRIQIWPRFILPNAIPSLGVNF